MADPFANTGRIYQWCRTLAFAGLSAGCNCQSGRFPGDNAGVQGLNEALLRDLVPALAAARG